METTKVEQTNTEANKTQETKAPPKFNGTFACATPQCGKASTLQCPSCTKLGLPNTYFCSQECFQSFWPIHKLFHKLSNFLSFSFFLI